MRIDYAVIADHAEVNSGKLYVSGGGWDLYRVQGFPAPVRLAVAMGVRVDWEETNTPIPVTVRIEHEDGAELAKVDGAVNVGRPPHLPPGSSQLAQVAVNFQAEVALAGGYRIVVSAGEADPAMQVIPFRVMKA